MHRFRFQAHHQPEENSIHSQGVDSPPIITISEYELYTMQEFSYLGSTIADRLHLDHAFDKYIGKAATAMNGLNKHSWSKNKLTEHSKYIRHVFSAPSY